MNHENVLRQRIEGGEPTIGTRVLSTWPGVIEALGQTGQFDYVEFLGEYAPYTDHDLENLARAAELHGLSTMIKVDGHSRTYHAQRALAAGIENVLFAEVDSRADAEEAVAAVRPPPEGENGIRMDRRIGYLGAYDGHEATHADLVERSRDAVVGVMIESEAAVEDVEEILSVEGVDLAVFGPSDHSLSAGRPGDVTHPESARAEEKTIETALDHDAVPRIEIGEPADAIEYREQYGLRHFNLNVDLSILHDWWDAKGAELRESLAPE